VTENQEEQHTEVSVVVVSSLLYVRGGLAADFVHQVA